MLWYDADDRLCVDCASFDQGSGCSDGMAATETTVACSLFRAAPERARTCLECSRLMPPDVPGGPFVCSATASDASWDDEACDMFDEG